MNFLPKNYSIFSCKEMYEICQFITVSRPQLTVIFGDKTVIKL